MSYSSWWVPARCGSLSVLVLLPLGVLRHIDVRLVLAGIVIGFLMTQLGR